ncbi:sulfurtransferase TusA family protein [Pseudoalteromonas sp. CO348]|uniref:sulfurtransferase TusA family protein n=1 Tax=Pseudoalteromonas sp. CO348 TaxID=1777271 RepID=UPI001023D7BA|nr:sulfurtransferase TusA family protein [Pseudoalteromonas sp. CO348]
MIFDVLLELKGKSCPIPLMLTKRELKNMASGEKVKIIFDDENTKLDLERFCSKGKCKITNLNYEKGSYVAFVEKI